MAEAKTEKLEREYTIPLRKEWRKVANYKRAGRAAREIKKFIVRHMKVPERDVSKVKLDVYLNNELWFRGKTKPPAKLKVKAVKEEEIVRVSLAETPTEVKFLKLKHVKRHLAPTKPVEEKKEKKEKEESKEEKEEKKEEEKEKSQAVAEARASDAKAQAKAQKHLTKVKEPGHHRMALKK